MAHAHVSNNCQSLRYPSYDPKTEIRLLAIPPALNSTRNDYSFQIAPLASAPPYELLSNAWGYDPDGVTIHIDKSRFLVTKELAETLDGLRRPGKTRYLWVGKLCIDNSSQEERSAQIKLMTEMLTKAERLIVPDGKTVGRRRSLSNL